MQNDIKCHEIATFIPSQNHSPLVSNIGGNQMKKKGMEKVMELTEKGVNLVKKVSADGICTDSVPIDNYRNRCLSYIVELESTAVPVEHSIDKHKAKVFLYNIYEHLQNFKGTERQDYDTERSISLEDIKDDEKSNAIQSATVYSGGGQGYAHVNWNSALFMSTHGKRKQSWKSPYWKPTGYKPVKTLEPDEYPPINAKQTIQEWREEMEKQKREMLSEVRAV